MSIAFRSSSSASEPGGFEIIIPAPAGVQAGDYLIAHISYHQGTDSTVTPPAGWALLRRDTSDADSGGSSGWIFTRTATGVEPGSYQFNLQDFRSAAGGIAAYSGVKTALPIDVSGATSAASTTAPTSPSITTLYTAPWLLWFLAGRENASTDSASAPAGMTERWHANAVAPGCVSLVADQVFGGPGASGTKTGAISPSAKTVTQVVFLSPADETVNHDPTAGAGPDRVTEVGAGVTLDGSASEDVDPGDVLTFAWTHISGPNGTAQLSNVAIATPLFTPINAGIDVFRLTVTDPGSASAHDEVTVTTTPVGVRFAQASGLSTTATVALPSDAAAGDMAFFATSMRPSSITPTVTTGWQAVMVGTQGSSSPDIQMWIYKKRLAAGDLGGSVSLNIDVQFDFHWASQVITVRNLHASAAQVARTVTMPLGVPRQFNYQIVGAAGSASYQYVVTAIDTVGETVASTNIDVSGAPNTLTGSNYVKLTWVPIMRAASYNVYGRTPAGTKFLIGNAPDGNVGAVGEYVCGFNDTGASPGVQTPPTQQPINMLLDGRGNDFLGDPLPERLYNTYANGKLLVFSSSQIVNPNPSATIADPASLSPMLTTIAPNDRIILHSSFQLLGAAGNIGTRLFTPSDYADSWVVIGLPLRPIGANGTPTAQAGFDQDAELGSTVYLDGSMSFDDDGDVLTYAWTRVSGPSVTLSNASTMFPSFVMPSSAVTFRLTVTDPNSASTTDNVTITPIIAGHKKVLKGDGTWHEVP